ncbi:MAG: hypothetical protein BYD32DRAFT_417026 [Podila humilis]|nr:MAG: hypothetical protein BYD32DRAFT_417026 [Podila humilis]
MQSKYLLFLCALLFVATTPVTGCRTRGETCGVILPCCSGLKCDWGADPQRCY